MPSIWTIEVPNADKTWTTIAQAGTELEAMQKLSNAHRVQAGARLKEWREVEPGEQVISKEEVESLLWWLDWTNEHMRQITDSNAEMARSGEIEKTAGAGWVNRVVQVSNLELKLKGKQNE